MTLFVTCHCRDRFRERIGPANLSNAEIDRRIRRACQSGRKASKREAREINDRMGMIAGAKAVRHPQHKSRRSRLILHDGVCFVVAPDRKVAGAQAVITCWPWPQQGADAAA